MKRQRPQARSNVERGPGSLHLFWKYIEELGTLSDLIGLWLQNPDIFQAVRGSHKGFRK